MEDVRQEVSAPHLATPPHSCQFCSLILTVDCTPAHCLLQTHIKSPLWNTTETSNVFLHRLTFSVRFCKSINTEAIDDQDFSLINVASCVWCSTMALQQAQLLLNMSSLEPVNFGVQQNNTEAFAVALCHLAELHAEQVTHLIWSCRSTFCPAVAYPLVSWPSVVGRL